MVIGGGTDGFNNYTQRGSFHHIEETLRALIETFPMLSPPQDAAPVGRHRRHDRRPLADHRSDAGPGNCFLNCGWGTGGFKAIPGSGWATAEMLAKGAPGALAGAVRPGALPRGPDDRRKRRGGGGALDAGSAQASCCEAELAARRRSVADDRRAGHRELPTAAEAARTSPAGLWTEPTQISQVVDRLTAGSRRRSEIAALKRRLAALRASTRGSGRSPAPSGVERIGRGRPAPRV